MLLRFALLTELQLGAGAPVSLQQVTRKALLSYGSSRTIEARAGWWPLLRHFAHDCLLQRQGS